MANVNFCGSLSKFLVVHAHLFAVGIRNLLRNPPNMRVWFSIVNFDVSMSGTNTLGLPCLHAAIGFLGDVGS